MGSFFSLYNLSTSSQGKAMLLTCMRVSFDLLPPSPNEVFQWSKCNVKLVAFLGGLHFQSAIRAKGSIVILVNPQTLFICPRTVNKCPQSQLSHVIKIRQTRQSWEYRHNASIPKFKTELNHVLRHLFILSTSLPC